MSKETDRIAAELLTDWVDSRKEAYDQLARPYREAAELRRRVNLAATYVQEIPCTCGQLVRGDRFVCDQHELAAILAGDV